LGEPRFKEFDIRVGDGGGQEAAAPCLNKITGAQDFATDAQARTLHGIAPSAQRCAARFAREMAREYSCNIDFYVATRHNRPRSWHGGYATHFAQNYK
jgi:hypothetical protein